MLVTFVLAMVLVLRLVVGVQDWQADTEVSAVVVSAGSPVVAARVDLAAVQALGLFGDSSGAGTAAAFGETAASGLDVQLEGVVVASRLQDSRAVLVIQGRQHSFRVGEVLPVGVDVTVKAIAADHVILGNDGRDEVLRLYDGARSTRQNAAGLAPAAAAPGSTAANNRGAAASAAPVPELQQRQQAAARLAEIIEVSPAAANGQLLGYRLAPGSRLKDFVQLGFKSGDVVTAVNGIALGDVGNLPELYRLMNEAGDVSFSLLRDGQPLTLDMTLAP